jgi:hypothetical protein
LDEYLGCRDVVARLEHDQDLPGNVLADLPGQDATVFTVNDEVSDTDLFSQRSGCGLVDCATMRYSRDGMEQYTTNCFMSHLHSIR